MFFFFFKEFLPFQLRAIFKSHPKKKKKSWLCFLNRWLGEQKQQGKVWLDFLYNLFISSEQKDSQSSAPHFLNQERKMPQVLDSLRSAKQSTEILSDWRGPGGTGRTSLCPAPVWRDNCRVPGHHAPPSPTQWPQRGSLVEGAGFPGSLLWSPLPQRQNCQSIQFKDSSWQQWKSIEITNIYLGGENVQVRCPWEW